MNVKVILDDNVEIKIMSINANGLSVPDATRLSFIVCWGVDVPDLLKDRSWFELRHQSPYFRAPDWICARDF